MRVIIASVVLSLSSGSAMAQDLKEILARRQQELADVTAAVNQAAASPAFTIGRDIHATIRVDLLQAWLKKMSSPELVVSAVGVRHEGDLYYQGGVGKAWIEPEHDTKMRVALAPLQLQGSAGQLEVSSTLAAHAETRIRTYIFNTGSNVFCQTVPDPTANVRAVFTLGTPVDGKLPYKLSLIEPSSIKGAVRCYLGALGAKDITFPIDDIARELNAGQIALGYGTSLQIELPGTPPRTISLKLEVKDATVVVNADEIDVGGNVSVAAASAPSGALH